MKANNCSWEIKFIFPLLVLGIFACSKPKYESPATDATVLKIDGSSTVFPITEHIVDLYKSKYNDLIVHSSVSGTGGGFEKFAKNEIDINNASRSIKESESVACASGKVSYQKFEVAYDGIAIVVNIENDWVDYLTVQELRHIWTSHELLWSDIRSNWPKKKIALYAPGEASGTHDYFRSAILKYSSMSKSIIQSENDNLLAKALSTNQYAIGFFGLGYFKKYSSQLNLIPLDNGNGAILPTQTTVESGEYAPLSRPMFIYVNELFCKKTQGKNFVKFYLENAADAAIISGYVALPAENYNKSIAQLENIYLGKK